MDEIKVAVKNIDNMQNETTVNTIGKIDRDKRTVTYFDNGIEVCVIIADKIIIKRESKEYKLELILSECEKNKSLYELFDPEYKMNIETETMVLKRENNNFYAEYLLNINNEEVGLFSVDFKVEE